MKHIFKYNSYYNLGEFVTCKPLTPYKMFQIFKEKTFLYMMISTKKFNGELGRDDKFGL
jgi:hypothetical protein